jgi:hypothetical protein
MAPRSDLYRAFFGEPGDGGEWPPRLGWLNIPIFIVGCGLAVAVPVVAISFLISWIL